MEHFQDLKDRGSPRGKFPDTTKSILVVALRNLSREEEFFCDMGTKIVTGSHSLGVLVRDRAAEYSWLAKKVKGWTESVKTIPGVARKHPQSAYTGLQKSLQKEWEFVQQVTPGIEDAIGLVEQGHTGPLPGIGGGNTRERGHMPTGETGGTGPT